MMDTTDAAINTTLNLNEWPTDKLLLLIEDQQNQIEHLKAVNSQLGHKLQREMQIGAIFEEIALNLSRRKK